MELLKTLMPLIITLVIILVIVIAVVKIKNAIKLKIQRTSREIFGTNDIISGIQKIKVEAQETPKSISSLDRLVVPKIKKDFPEMEIDELKAKNIDKIYAVLHAIDSGDMVGFEENSNVKNQIKSMAKDFNNKNLKISDIKIHNQSIMNYSKTTENASISMQIALEYVLTNGNNKNKHQKKIETQWVYLLDSSNFSSNHILTKTCPNCGGVITNLGDKKCSYCGSDVIVDYTKTWSFNSVKFLV